MSTGHPETSIIIRAFNEERWLPEVFAALHRQLYRDFEVLLVDSGSVDRTRDIAAENGARIVHLRSEDFTFGHSLNVGIEAAHGEFMAIISAHAIPSDEHWLGKLVEPLRRPGVAMVYGGQRAHALTKFSEARDFERVFPDTPHEITDPEKPFANNANSAILRSLWKSHGFDEGLPGLEDIEWAAHWLNKGRKVAYEPAACVIHVHTETWPQVRRRYYREGMASRWVGLLILRHIPLEIFREIRWCLHDLLLAARAGQFVSLFRSILRFRYEKTLGTIGGITDSRGLDNPARRSELYFGNGFPALVVRGPNRLELEQRRVPSLKPGEILVRISHVGLSSVDVELIEGTLGRYRSGSARYPIVPGHESSGTVVAVGPKVTELIEGDRVVVESIQGCGECEACQRDESIRCGSRRELGVFGEDGACAAYMVTRARYVHKVPTGVTLAEAALAEPLAAVHKGLRRLGSRVGGDTPRNCAVVGAGTIGHLAATMLAFRGHKVTVFDPEATRLGALDASIPTSTELTSLDRFEWIVEATGTARVLSDILERSGSGSTVLLLGLPHADHPIGLEGIVAYDRAVVGTVGSSKQDFRDALQVLASIDTGALLRTTFRLEEYERAIAAVKSPSSLKVMLTCDPVSV